MVRKCLFFVLLFIGIVHFSLGEEIGQYKEIQSQKNQKASATAEEKDFYVILRFGLSTLTGLVGIELQHKHVAFDIGYAPGSEVKHYLTFGIKYYFNSHHSTAYIGLGSGIGKEIDENVWRSHLGPIFGYRWRWGKGWDFNLGIGFAFGIGKDAPTPPMLELAFGCTF